MPETVMPLPEAVERLQLMRANLQGALTPRLRLDRRALSRVLYVLADPRVRAIITQEEAGS